MTLVESCESDCPDCPHEVLTDKELVKKSKPFIRPNETWEDKFDNEFLSNPKSKLCYLTGDEKRALTRFIKETVTTLKNNRLNSL